jgi:hypothetical protein
LVSQLREDLLLCSSYLLLGVPNGLLLTSHQATVIQQGLKKDKAQQVNIFSSDPTKIKSAEDEYEGWNAPHRQVG